MKLNPPLATLPKLQYWRIGLLFVVIGGIFMKEIPLTQKKVALIDDDMFDRVSYFKWHTIKDGNTYYARANYRFNNEKYTTITMHQLILGFPKINTDHKDCNGLNNQNYNLRIATVRQNGMNRIKKLGLSSKYKGVSWRKDNNKWQVCIKNPNGKYECLGQFASEIIAATIYNSIAIKYFGEFARINVIDNSVINNIK